jgi:hypothetical protein
VYVAAAVLVASLSTAIPARAANPVVKVAFFNIKSGKGQVGLSGHPVLFSDTTNCTDTSQPLNAWGVGAVQAAIGNALSDPSVVALGLAEAWTTTCGSGEHVRQLLGWKAKTGEQNGITLLARYGFAGPEKWQQLDTSLNTTPSDTMWVVMAPVCLDAACSQSMPVYVAHWYGTGTYKVTTYDKQAQQTAAFLQATSGGLPHVLVGDLNVFEGSSKVCDQNPNNTSLSYLRNAGYMDAWLTVHGAAEGYTGMVNRAGCGYPEGYAWKRIDYAWSLGSFTPVDIQRFAIVTAGDAAPSDHYGIVATFPYPGTPTTTSSGGTSTSGTGGTGTSGTSSTSSTSSDETVLYAKRATVHGAWQFVDDATAAGGTRVWNPDKSAAKITTPLASPAAYFELTFTPKPGVPYHLWVRGKAEGNYWANDSVYLQFSGTVTSAGAPVYRIGTTSATTMNLEDGSGVGVSGWGWQDNGYGVNVMGEPLYFDGTPQTVRVQVREDGLSIDQIVLSAAQFLAASPGSLKNDTTILPETQAAGTAPVPAVTWETAVNVALTATSVTKSAGCDGCADAAVSGATRVTDTDAYFEFTPTLGTRMMIGFLPEGAAATDFRSMRYALGFWKDGSYDIRDQYNFKTDGRGSAGDTYAIGLEGSTVRFYRNGAVIYSMPRTGGLTLRVGAVLFTPGATFSEPVADVTAGGLK